MPLSPSLFCCLLWSSPFDHCKLLLLPPPASAACPHPEGRVGMAQSQGQKDPAAEGLRGPRLLPRHSRAPAAWHGVGPKWHSTGALVQGSRDGGQCITQLVQHAASSHAEIGQPWCHCWEGSYRPDAQRTDPQCSCSEVNGATLIYA